MENKRNLHNRKYMRFQQMHTNRHTKLHISYYIEH